MNVSRFKPSLVYTISIAATPERVWQALKRLGVKVPG